MIGEIKAGVFGLSLVRFFLFGLESRGFFSGFSPFALKAFELVVGFAGHAIAFRRSAGDGLNLEAPQPVSKGNRRQGN